MDDTPNAVHTIADRLTIVVTITHNATNEEEIIVVPFRLAWALHQVTEVVGGLYTKTLIESGAGALKGPLVQEVQGTVKGPDYNLNDHDRYILNNFATITRVLLQECPTAEDLLLRVSYDGLRKRLLTRASAAALATEMLQRSKSKQSKPIGTEAWRKRVDRFAEREGLAKVEQYKRGIKDSA